MVDYGMLIKPKFDQKLFNSALNLEKTNPKRALTYYERLEKANTTLFIDILLLSIFCPLLAFGIGFWLTTSLNRFPPYFDVLILAVLGYGLPLGVFQSRLIQIQGGILRQQIPKFRKQQVSMVARLKDIVVGIFWYLWGDYWKLVIILMWAFMFILPVFIILYFLSRVPIEGIPNEIPESYILVALILACVHTFSGRDIIPLFPIRRILAETIAGLWLNRRDILEFFANIWIGGVLVSGAWGLARDDFNQGLLTNVIAGVLLGLTISKIEHDRLLENIIILGRIRCLLILGRSAENYHWFRAVYDYPFYMWFTEVGALTAALSLLHSVQIGERSVIPADVVSCLDQAAEVDKLPAGYHDIWLAGVRRSKLLLQHFQDTIPVS